MNDIELSKCYVIGTLSDLICALDTHNVIVNFNVLNCPNISYRGSLTKFIESNIHFQAFKMCNVIYFNCKIK